MVIAVCIPTYNQSDFLRQAVDSALAQRDCEIEVWVSDDCSSDATPLVMQAYTSDLRVHYYRQPINLGIAGNAGWIMAQPKANYIVRLDSDDLLEPDYCAKLSEALSLHTSAAVAHSAVREIGREGDFRRLRLLRRSSGLESGDNAFKNGIKGYRVSANICMFRVEALLSVEPYRLSVSYCEDWDLFMRLADAGWGNFYLDEVLASYRVWTDGKNERAKRKHAELTGIMGIFDDVITPGWRRRGWPVFQLQEARINLACSHAQVITASHWTLAEADLIVDDLRKLALGSERIEKSIRYHKSFFGKFLSRFGPLKVWLKDTIKRFLKIIR